MEILSQTEIIEQVGGWPQAVVITLFILVFVGLSIFFGTVCNLDALDIPVGLAVSFLVLFLTEGE